LADRGETLEKNVFRQKVSLFAAPRGRGNSRMTDAKAIRAVRGKGKTGRMLSRSVGGNILLFLLLLSVSLFMFIPLFYAAVQAFKPMEEIFAFPPKFFVKNPTLNNFLSVFQLAGNLWVPFSRYVFNSVFVSAFGTALYILVASLAAYPLSKHAFPGRSVLLLLVVWAMLFRPEVTGVAQYIVISKLHLINSNGSIILPALASTFGVFLMKQFMEVSVPDSTLEAARIDGASEYRIFFKLVMPAVKPAWLTLMIFTFQLLWNTTGVSYIYDESQKMLPSVLSAIAASGIARVGAGSAVAVLLMIPPVVLFVISQNSIMETMSHSGMK
jgi:ABC-type glycerol-3-phosphate transport system permease component